MGNTLFYIDPREHYHFFRRWDEGMGSIDFEAVNLERLAMAMANSRSLFTQDYQPESGIPQGAVQGSTPVTDSQMDNVLVLLKRELGLPARIRRGVSRRIEELSYILRRSEIEY